MKKLALDVDTLTVQTFQTAPGRDPFDPDLVVANPDGTSACAFTDCTCGFTVCQEH
ncbi:MAG TPA: hypothetical protein VHG91_07375 [Longimicrobium sp.]|nr:hypothetical protein [Longimicrobium sp.]